MTASGATTFAYDKNGNQTSRTNGTTTTAYAYDFEDGLVKAGTETYARDALGRVASSTIGTTKTDYVFDGPEVLQERVGTAAATHYTRGLGDTLISRRAGTNAPNYYHYDAVGSVTALSSGGALTDSYLYTAFGNSRGKTGTTAQPYQYLGNALDSNSGFYDFHARAYNPGVGRFTSKDPVRGYAELPQTLNPYAYGRDNPYRYPDPYGLGTRGICFSASAGFGWGGTLQQCYVTDGLTIKKTESIGGGAQLVPGTFLGGGYQKSNAAFVDSLQGVGGYADVSVTALFGGQGGVLGGTDSVTGKPYHGWQGQVGVDPTDEVPIPFSSQAGASYTKVSDIPVITGLAEYYLNEPAKKK